MKADPRIIENTLKNLSVICEQHRKKQITYAEFQQSYSEHLSFINSIDFPIAIKKRILALPKYPKPSFLTSPIRDTFLPMFAIFSLIGPYFAIIMAILLAPISFPIILWSIITRKRIESNLLLSVRIISSIIFLIEHPNLDIETDN